jgi:rhodanese-related sulfurtransferase
MTCFVTHSVFHQYLRRLTLAGFVMFVAVMPVALTSPTLANASEDVVEAMGEYLMFQDYLSGVIRPEQIDQSIFEAVVFIDTRTSDQFEAGSIPGALHIEWREVIERIDEIPQDQKTILFCNTGVLSAQAVFALRVAGFENVLVLQGGYQGWQENAAYKP